jgi:hypothetical protein
MQASSAGAHASRAGKEDKANFPYVRGETNWPSGGRAADEWPLMPWLWGLALRLASRTARAHRNVGIVGARAMLAAGNQKVSKIFGASQPKAVSSDLLNEP